MDQTKTCVTETDSAADLMIGETTSGGAEQASAGRRLAWTLAATSLGLIVVQLDITIVNVALPHIGTQLGAAVGGL